MKIATWNIKSIRLRKENVINFLKNENIDILCLQETKTVDEQIPITFFYNYWVQSYEVRRMLKKLEIQLSRSEVKIITNVS